MISLPPLKLPACRRELQPEILILNEKYNHATKASAAAYDAYILRIRKPRSGGTSDVADRWLRRRSGNGGRRDGRSRFFGRRLLRRRWAQLSQGLLGSLFQLAEQSQQLVLSRFKIGQQGTMLGRLGRSWFDRSRLSRGLGAARCVGSRHFGNPSGRNDGRVVACVADGWHRSPGPGKRSRIFNRSVSAEAGGFGHKFRREPDLLVFFSSESDKPKKEAVFAPTQ